MEFRELSLLKLRDWIPIDKVSWGGLFYNPAAIHILEKNLSKIDWWWLSVNPAAIYLLKQNLDMVNWYLLSSNPAAIYLLEANMSKINGISWCYLSQNPAIFTYDYQKIKEKKRELNKEVCEAYWHPSRMDSWQWQNED